MDLQLRNKTALVTGASVGIGRGIALALAAEGREAGHHRAPGRKSSKNWPPRSRPPAVPGRC